MDPDGSIGMGSPSCFRPVTDADWRQLDAVIGGFLRSAVDQRRGTQAAVQQCPASLAQLGVEIPSSS